MTDALQSDTISDPNLKPRDITKIEQTILPKIAQVTGGTFTSQKFARADQQDDESDDGEDDDDKLAGVLSEDKDLLGNILDANSLQVSMDKLASRFAAVTSTTEDNIDLIDFSNDLSNLIILEPENIFPTKAEEELDRIIMDLQDINFGPSPEEMIQGQNQEFNLQDIDFGPLSDEETQLDFDPASESLFTPVAMRHHMQDISPFLDRDALFPAQPASQATDKMGGTILKTPVRPISKGKIILPDELSYSPRPVRKTIFVPPAAFSEGPSLDGDDLSKEEAVYFVSPTKLKSNAPELLPPLPPPNFGSKPISTTPTSVIVTTPTLKQLGMKYNLDYHIVICDACKGGYIFNSFVNHAYKGAIMTPLYDPRKKMYIHTTQYHNQPRILRGKGKKGRKELTNKEVEDVVLQELRDLGHKPDPFSGGSTKEDLPIWIDRALPHYDQVGPIAGIAVFPHGFQCQQAECADEDFPFCCLSWDVMRHHFRSQHSGVKPTRDKNVLVKTLQTLCALRAYICYFEVPSGKLQGIASPSPKDVSLEDAIRLEQDDLFGSLTGDKGLDTDLINPAFVDIGIVAFWDTFDMDAIKPLQNIFSTVNKTILKEEYFIRQAVLATFFDICLHVKTANAAILYLIMKGAMNESAPPKRFTIPRPKTLMHYVSVEVLLLRWLIYALEHPILNKKGETIFQFDELQSGSLQALILSARKQEPVITIAGKAVAALHHLYFPSNPDRSAFNVFIEPLNAFIGILSLTPDGSGSPRPLDDINHYCARLQFSMRLRGYHYLYTTHATIYKLPSKPEPREQIPVEATMPVKGRHPTRSSTRTKVPTSKAVEASGSRRTTHLGTSAQTADKSTVDSDSDDYDPSPSTSTKESNVPAVGTMSFMQVEMKEEKQNWWKNIAVPWCASYLTEGEATPYANVRNIIHQVSAAIRSRRKPPQVCWINDQTLLLDKHKIELDVFRDFLHFRLEHLELFIRDNILLGYTLEDLDISVNFDALGDTGDTITPWYSPLMGNLDGNPDSQKALRKFVDDGKLLQLQNGQLLWNIELAEQWAADIHTGTSETHNLVHITEGSAGRITEESKTQCSNSRTGRRHIFVTPGMDTLCIWSNYWKGTTKSGTFKEILRVFPNRVSRLVFIIVRVIRPIIALYLAKHRISADLESRLEFRTTYRASLWATLGSSLTPTQMYNNFFDFMGSPGRDGEITFPFPFGARRYRQFVVAVQRKHISMSPRYTQKEAEEETSVGDLQAGRSSITSDQEYAVEESTVDRSPGFTNHYIAYSRKWHEFWGMSTEPRQDDQYFV